MNFKMFFIIPLAVMAVACGDATTTAGAASASLSLPVGAAFDASGLWKTVSTTCASFAVPSQFDNTIQAVSGNVQTFTVATSSEGSMVFMPSEGTLDSVTGAYTLCYSSSLSNCEVQCTGTVGSVIPVGAVGTVAPVPGVTLGCNVIANNGACTIVLQK